MSDILFSLLFPACRQEGRLPGTGIKCAVAAHQIQILLSKFEGLEGYNMLPGWQMVIHQQRKFK
jgi:hypothetical protein